VPEEDRGCNSGVFREDTPTLIVIVSDEGDASSVLPGSPPPLELEGCVQEHSDDPAFGQCECRLDWWHRFFQGIGREVVFVTVGPTYQLSTDEVALCDGSATSVAGPCNPFGSAVCPIDFYQRVACLTDGRFFPVLETIEPDQPATCEVADFGLIRDAIRDMLVGVAPDPS
jgi:hypothetical protein